MPISEKIITRINDSEVSQEEKKLMLEILQVEDKGSFRCQAEYEALIKKYIEEQKETI